MTSDPYVLRELDHVRSAIESLEGRTSSAIEKMGAATAKSVDSLAETLRSHNGRLTKVERAHERIQGAKDFMGNWRPLGIAVVGGTVVSLVTRLL